MQEFVSADGVRLAYETAGSGSPPMVFVHGWSCDRSHFAPLLRHFAATHQVLALDLRGHGDSGRPEPVPGSYDIGVLADDVLAVAEAAGLREPLLVGHSLGALIGLDCAARPGALGALLMIDPAPITNEKVKEFFRESFGVVSADSDGSWRTDFVRGMFLPGDQARRADILREMPATPAAIAAAVMRAMGEFDGAAALGEISVPVLSIGSAAPTNASKDLRSRCRSITIGQTVGAGHFIQLEVPEQVIPMIERFLAVNGLSARP
jgi:pimeloyl-ACP methyl ester carboxylesterase